VSPEAKQQRGPGAKHRAPAGHSGQVPEVVFGLPALGQAGGEREARKPVTVL